MAEKLVEVFLKRSCGPRNGPLYGPGRAMVPESFAKALELSPDMIETDVGGTAGAHTLAAAAGVGTAAGTTAIGAPAIPHPARNDDDDAGLVDADGTGSPSAASAYATDVADNAEKGADRQGNTLRGESGSLTTAPAEGMVSPGQTEVHAEATAQLERERATADAAGTRTTRAGRANAAANPGNTNAANNTPENPPATKTALREAGDLDALKELGRKNNVKGADDWTNKDDAVDALYDARVSLE